MSILFLYVTRLRCSAVQRAMSDLSISKRQGVPNNDHAAAIWRLNRIGPRMRFKAKIQAGFIRLRMCFGHR